MVNEAKKRSSTGAKKGKASTTRKPAARTARPRPGGKVAKGSTAKASKGAPKASKAKAPAAKKAAPRATKAAKAAPRAATAKAPKKAAQAGHDTGPPEALVAFMLRDWSKVEVDSSPIAHAEAFRARRRALSAMFPGETLIIPTGHEKVRANDTHYRFRPGTDFYYLTGNHEPDCVLAMVPDKAGGHRDVLFVEPNPGRSDPTFFTDRKKGELWVGPRLGVPESQRRFGVDEARGLPGLGELLGRLKAKKTRVLRGVDEPLDASLPGDKGRDAEFAQRLSEMRLLKEPIEVDELSTAIASTKRGFEDVIARLKKARSEREVEGVFNLRARVEGNDVGYGTIAACGHHACVLHWTHNDGQVKAGDLLLLDAGVEGTSLYTADITRCLPVSGTFSPEQREIYELVLAAQEAAMARVAPGNDFLDPNRAAMEVLARGLEKLGILPSADEALRDDNQFYKRYTLHNVSHMLGLDVHDCAQARAEAYKFGKLVPGMVLTVEPGLYFQIDDRTVPEKYRGIGVRIEDDVLVTADGCRNLSADIPKTTAEVEAWMAEVWSRKDF